MYRDLENNGPKKICIMAKMKTRRAQHIDRLVLVKVQQDRVLTENDHINSRWRQYFDVLLKTRNNRRELDKIDKAGWPIPEVTMEKVRKQLEKMANKATDPDELPIKVIKLMTAWIGVDESNVS